MKSLDSALIEYIRNEAASDRYAAYLRNTLLELVAINTAPEKDLEVTTRREREFFDFVEKEIKAIAGDAVTCERVPFDPAIAEDPAYTPPAYTADETGQVLPADQAYAGRANFVALVPGENPEPGAIVHAHADVVPPWFGPRSAGDRVFGRGSADDKAQIAIILAQLKLMMEAAEKLGRKPAKGFVIQLALDEEIGGNGSLALSRESRFAGLPALVLDASDLVPYCAHRGAIYYRCKLSVGDQKDTTAVEMFPFVVRELEEEGRRFKAQTDTPLFTAKHVQTNQGMLGPYGKHPGNVCDHVAIEIVAKSNANPDRIGMLLIEFMEEALKEYFQLYGDKQREIDPATGQPKVERHFDLKVNPTTETQNFRVDVWGKAGHMAAVADCDNAVTKAAFLLGALLRMAPNFPRVKAYGRFPDSSGDDREIVLEGGQGFTPSHPIEVVRERITAAALRGVQAYCRMRKIPFEEGMIETTFERLHNDAYAASPEIAPMQALKNSFEALGEPWPTPVAWQTSCDARLYHNAGYPVAVFGAGKLEVCHSQDEYVDIADLQKGLAVTTLATWSLIQ